MAETAAGLLALFGGPAGAGKSTLARAWCETRGRAVHIELDRVRELIVAGRADPQQPGELQSEQYQLSVRACMALARSFLESGYDVAIDDVFDPVAFERDWRPLVAGLQWRAVIVLPSLEETLARSRAREKRVLEMHTRDQHAASQGWPASVRVDSTDLSIDESLTLVQRIIDGPMVH
ncbi:MAG: AAA family ATPase [Dehalococcoidia bacterium]